MWKWDSYDLHKVSGNILVDTLRGFKIVNTNNISTGNGIFSKEVR